MAIGRPRVRSREEQLAALSYDVAVEVEKILIEKAGRRFTDAPGTFIGELSLLTHGPASATVSVGPGTSYVVWDSKRLQKMVTRSPAMKQALDILMTRDVAAKLQRS